MLGPLPCDIPHVPIEIGLDLWLPREVPAGGPLRQAQSPSCARVYSDDENYAVNVHEKFNIILLLTVLGWGSGIFLGIFLFRKN